MGWLAQNWVWILFFAAFIGMHLFGHGGHGGHDGRSSETDEKPVSPGEGKSQRSPGQSGHRH